MQHVRNGFTMVEIIVVVTVIGILAAMVVPKFANAQSEAAVAAAGEDMIGMSRAIEYNYTENGFWPAETAAGVAPPEILARFKGENPFAKPCPIGGVYDYEYTSTPDGVVTKISLKATLTSPAPSISDALSLDAFFDDGVLDTGRFQADGLGYSYRISK